jgi:hypothetical protein
MSSRASSGTTQKSESYRALLSELRGMLRSAQNSDGGWAFHHGGESRVEPTCWAIRALAGVQTKEGLREILTENLERAVEFLTSRQGVDGSWPASHGIEAGGWITSLACSVLSAYASEQSVAEAQNACNIQKAIQAALKWLCDDYPRDSSGWQKFLKGFRHNKNLVEHSDEFRGWGWTPRTASWVEPTAFALMAFSDAGSAVPAALAKLIAERKTLATGLLCDRMCPRGGWNCGNPRVYGVDGDPLVLPTCWALLALRDEPEHAERTLSLAWLRDEFDKIESAGSLAMARITVECYGLVPPEASRSLLGWPASELLELGTHVAAWVALALDAQRAWPPISRVAAAQAKK